MLTNMTETTQKIFKSKMEEIENNIKEKEKEIENNQNILLDKERYVRQLNSKIKELEKQKETTRKELTREEYLKKVDYFLINSKEDIQVVLK